jgi:transcription termination factor Rho
VVPAGLLLVWPPSTADQLLESLEQLNQFATAAMTAEDPAAATAAAADADAAATPEAAAPSAEAAAAPAAAVDAAAGDVAPLLQLQLRRSRLVNIPSPQDAGLSGVGLGADRKPAVATADSSVSGLAGAIEARVARAGAAWLWSDGSKQAHATAWQALLLASSKMDAADGAGGLLALVDVQQQAAASAEQQEQPQAESSPELQQQQQEQKQQKGGKGGQQRRRQQQPQQQERSSKLKMLIVRDSDIARSILQVSVMT